MKWRTLISRTDDPTYAHSNLLLYSLRSIREHLVNINPLQMSRGLARSYTKGPILLNPGLEDKSLRIFTLAGRRTWGIGLNRRKRVKNHH